MTGRGWRVEALRVFDALREHAVLCPRCKMAGRPDVLVSSDCEAGAVLLSELIIARCEAVSETTREQLRAVTSPPARVSQ